MPGHVLALSPLRSYLSFYLFILHFVSCLYVTTLNASS